MKKATRLLTALEPDPRGATETLLPVIYDELRRLAAYRLTHERPDQTLQATALVHEAYLHLAQAGCDQWEDSRHFFNAMAEAMRHILIDSARRKQSLKHGGSLKRLSLEDTDLPVATSPNELLDLDNALESLAQAHPEEAQVVKLRYFVGLTQEEAARVLGVSRRTINNRWSFARAWLYQSLHPEEAGPPQAK